MSIFHQRQVCPSFAPHFHLLFGFLRGGGLAPYRRGDYIVHSCLVQVIEFEYVEVLTCLVVQLVQMYINSSEVIVFVYFH